MGIKIGNIDVLNELINNRLNIEVILSILAQKGLITQTEFNFLKEELAEKFKKEHPELLPLKKKKSKKK